MSLTASLSLLETAESSGSAEELLSALGLGGEGGEGFKSSPMRTGLVPSSSAERIARHRRSLEREAENAGVDLPELRERDDLWQLSAGEVERVAPLGTGTFGKVFLGRRRVGGQLCAIKSVSKALVLRYRHEARLVNERRVLAGINSPFVVRLYGTSQDECNIYFYLEYLPGGELFTRIHSRKRDGRPIAMRTSHARFYMAELVCAFEFLHRYKVMYRDLKPENVILDADGHVRLVDMGFAVQVGTKSFSICGTTEYMAPEMAQGRGAGVACDWWSMGILLYEMLTRYTPFKAADKMATYRRIITEPVRFPSTFPSRSARALIRGLLSKDPMMRLGTSAGGVAEVREHPFFGEIDWKACAARQLPPPWAPKVSAPDDTRNFITAGQDFSESTVTLRDCGIDEKEMPVFEDF